MKNKYTRNDVIIASKQLILSIIHVQQVVAKKPAGPPAKKQNLKGKGQKKKKVSLKFTIDCTHPVEDNIMDVANFVSLVVNLVNFIRNPSPKFQI